MPEATVRQNSMAVQALLRQREQYVEWRENALRDLDTYETSALAKKKQVTEYRQEIDLLNKAIAILEKHNA